ncbi:MAG: DMP19 family protein [Polyangiaceae bacterium]|nr:DMP19 family protein [Polyangiaceae bacterium]
MNCTAFAFVVLLPIGIVMAVWWWRRRWQWQPTAAASSPPSANPKPCEAPILSDEVSRRYEVLGFDGLTEAERVWVAVEELQMDVNNGGFDQYYFNSSGDTAWFAPTALRTIGADKTASIVEKANAMFGPEGPPKDREQSQEALERLRGDDDAVLFAALDDEFFKYPDDVEELLRSYLRREGLLK